MKIVEYLIQVSCYRLTGQNFNITPLLLIAPPLTKITLNPDLTKIKLQTDYLVPCGSVDICVETSSVANNLSSGLNFSDFVSLFIKLVLPA